MSGVASTRRKGARGEEAAAAYLAAQGWVVRDRNYRTRRGEIDIVATRDDLLAFVEVKAWGSLPRDELGRAVNGRKRARITGAARCYVAERPDLADRHMRFNVVFIDTRSGGIELIPGAWSGEGID